MDRRIVYLRQDTFGNWTERKPAAVLPLLPPSSPEPF
jgi:hypothetical protein